VLEPPQPPQPQKRYGAATNAGQFFNRHILLLPKQRLARLKSNTTASHIGQFFNWHILLLPKQGLGAK